MCIMYTYMYTYLTTCIHLYNTHVLHICVYLWICIHSYAMYTNTWHIRVNTHTHTHTYIYTIFNIFGERERERVGKKRERERKKEWYYGYRMSHFRNKIDMIALDSRCYVGRKKRNVCFFFRAVRIIRETWI